MKRIILFVIHKIRDLRASVQLKVLLESHGHNVKIISIGRDSIYQISKFKPHAILLPTMMSTMGLNIARECHNKGIKVIGLCSEGVVSEETEDVFGGIYTDYSYADLILVWGKEMSNILLKYNKDKNLNIKISGNPGFDNYRPPLNRLAPNKKTLFSPLGIPTDKKVVMLATGFRLADLKPVKSAIPEAAIGKFEESKGRFKFQRDSRQACIKSIGRIAKQHPNVAFVIKLHPFEKSKFYASAQKTLPLNVYLIHQQEMFKILPHIDLLLHWESTTSVEAWFCGKPTINVPLASNTEPAVIVSGGDVVKSFDELEKRVAYYLASGDIPKSILRRRSKLVDKWFHRIDGKSTSRCAREVDKLLQNPQELASFSTRENITNFLVGAPRIVFTHLSASAQQLLFNIMCVLDPSHKLLAWDAAEVVNSKLFTKSDVAHIEQEIKQVIK